MTDTDTTLDAVADAATKLKALTASRAEAVLARDAAAWSLHAVGDPDAHGKQWTHSEILARFGTVSHDAWTKSRKRMKDAYPDRKPDYVPDAPARLDAAVASIRATDEALAGAERAYLGAVLAAAEGGATQSKIAAAAGVSRQAIHTMLKRELAA